MAASTTRGRARGGRARRRGTTNSTSAPRRQREERYDTPCAHATWPTVLHVAEKPAVAKRIMEALRGTAHVTRAKPLTDYNAVWSFERHLSDIPLPLRDGTAPCFIVCSGTCVEVANGGPLAQFRTQLSTRSDGHGDGSGRHLHGQRGRHDLTGGQQVQVFVTSVLGHLCSNDFGEAQSWRRLDGARARELLDPAAAPILRRVAPQHDALARGLGTYGAVCTWLVLWLDCDREGEAIGYDVIAASAAKRRTPLPVVRAVFSSLGDEPIRRAAAGLTIPNRKRADAALARAELDLRAGCALTRLQTAYLRPLVAGEEGHVRRETRMDQKGQAQSTTAIVLSYGACQFPTLGFVVAREVAIRRFVAEPFWTIEVPFAGNDRRVILRWARGNVFDQAVASLCLGRCTLRPDAVGDGETTVMPVAVAGALTVDDRQNSTHSSVNSGRTSLVVNGRIVSVESTPKTRARPNPLTTVRLLMAATQHGHMTSERCMKVAEKLYNNGFMSYPRSETNQYDAGFEHRPILTALSSASGAVGAWANQLVQAGELVPQRPTGARATSDESHPPVHPIKPLAGALAQDRESAVVYDIVVRYYLACLSKDAKGTVTRVRAVVGKETFVARGTVVHERNFLDIITPYEKWDASGNVSKDMVVGATFDASAVALRRGMTAAPRRLTERDLLRLMDRYGIGTDATMADHVAKICTRDYASKRGNVFHAEPRGIALVQAYYRLQIDLWRPDLRRRMEEAFRDVEQGAQERHAVVEAMARKYAALFSSVVERGALFRETFRTVLHNDVDVDIPESDDDNDGDDMRAS